MSRVLIGVSGSVAAYKAVELVRLAIRAGHAVRVIQTPNAQRFVGPATFAAITGAPVLSGEFDDDPLRGAYPGDAVAERAPITHLALVERADVYLVAPASANTIADLAAGRADSLVSAAALAAGDPARPGSVPVIVAPAMNDRMYHHQATQANLQALRRRGVTIVGPGSGELASHGEHGDGRMSEPPELLAAMQRVLAEEGTGAGAAAGPAVQTHSAAGADPTPGTVDAATGPAVPGWLGRRVLVTAGGTREPIDAVRFIGNRSSGRMGYALAARAAGRGAQVTLVSANVSLPAPPGVRRLEVGTAEELRRACEAQFDAADVLLMVAAVADFRPRRPAGHKLKKDEGPPRLELEATADVLAALAARRRDGQVLVGFAAEHGEGGLDHARDKVARKRVDAIVLNDVSQPGIGFDTADNEVTVLTADGGRTPLARAGKDEIADGILDEVERLWTQREETDVRGADAGRPARV